LRHPDEFTDFYRIICDPTHPHGLTDQLAIAHAIAGWAKAGPEHLDRQRRSELVRMITDPTHPKALTDPKARAVAAAGMGAGWKHLLLGERTELYRVVSDNDHPHYLKESRDRGTAISGWGPGLGDMQRHEVGNLVSMLDERHPSTAYHHSNFTETLAGMGQGLKDMSWDERVVVVAMGCVSPHGHSIGGLATGLDTWTTPLLTAPAKGLEAPAKGSIPLTREFDARPHADRGR
jgi:hypothetical protein